MPVVRGRLVEGHKEDALELGRVHAARVGVRGERDVQRVLDGPEVASQRLVDAPVTRLGDRNQIDALLCRLVDAHELQVRLLGAMRRWHWRPKTRRRRRRRYGADRRLVGNAKVVFLGRKIESGGITDQISLIHNELTCIHRIGKFVWFEAEAGEEDTRQRFEHRVNEAQPGGLELGRLNVRHADCVGDVHVLNELNESVDGVLTQCGVATRRLLLVRVVVHLEIELEGHVVHTGQYLRHEGIGALRGLVKPAAFALIDDEHRVGSTSVSQHVLLKSANELVGVVGEAALLDHEEHQVDAVVDLVEDAAHLRQNVGGVEVGRAEADRVDDGELVVGLELEVERARAGVLAHLEAAVVNARHVAALLEQTVA